MDAVAEKDSLHMKLFAHLNSTILKMSISFRLDNFSFQQHLTSSLFSPSIKSSDLHVPDLDGVWYLVIIPSIMSRREGEEKERPFVSLHLRRDSATNKEVPTRFYLRIVNDDGATVYHRDCAKPVIFSGKGSGSVMWGWDRFISHDDLFNPSNGYLPDDTLTIEAEIHCLATTRTYSHNVSPMTSCSTMMTDLRGMYESKEFCDFVLTTSDGKDLPAHRAILAARSEVFCAMVHHDTKERQTGKCQIVDLDSQTVEALLEYMYCDSITSLQSPTHDSHMAEELLKAADKYRVSGLKITCEYQLMNDVTQENAARLLVLADMHSLDHLKGQVRNFLAVRENLLAFMRSGGVDVVCRYKNDLLEEVVSTNKKALSKKK